MLALYFVFISGIELKNKNIKVRLVKNGNNRKELEEIHRIGSYCIKDINVDIEVFIKHITEMNYIYDPLPPKNEISCSDEKHTRKIAKSLFENLDKFVDKGYYTNDFKNMINMLKDKDTRSQICDMSAHVVI